MEFYDKFVDKFQYMLEESSCKQDEGLIINCNFQEKMCLEIWSCYYQAAIAFITVMTMSLLESSTYGMVPWNF